MHPLWERQSPPGRCGLHERLGGVEAQQGEACHKARKDCVTCQPVRGPHDDPRPSEGPSLCPCSDPLLQLARDRKKNSFRVHGRAHLTCQGPVVRSSTEDTDDATKASKPRRGQIRVPPRAGFDEEGKKCKRCCSKVEMTQNAAQAAAAAGVGSESELTVKEPLDLVKLSLQERVRVKLRHERELVGTLHVRAHLLQLCPSVQLQSCLSCFRWVNSRRTTST